MTSIRIRPKVRNFSNHSEEVLIDNYRRILSSGNYPFRSKIAGHHISVTFKKEEIHFWTPELNLDIVRNYLQDDEYAEQKEPTLLRGYISPNPSVWAMFLFTYSIIGLSFLGFMVWGSSQMLLGQESMMYWYALVCVLLAILVFVSTQIGQKIAENQTALLLQFVDEGLGGDVK